MPDHNRSRANTFAFVLSAMLVLSVVTIVVVLAAYSWRGFTDKRSLDKFRAEALSSPANGLVMPADEVKATEMYIDLDGMLRSDAIMPLREPSLSPDCKFLAYMDPMRGSGDICLLNLKDKTTRVLVGTSAHENEPLFSDDGKKVYFFRAHNGGRHVFSVNIANGTVSQITTGPSINKVIDISNRDGSLRVQRDPVNPDEKSFVAGVYRVKTDQRPPQEERIDRFYFPVAGGRYLAFSTDEDSESVWLQDLKDSTKKRVGAGSIYEAHPSRRLLMVVHRSQQYQTAGPNSPLAILDLDSGKEQMIGDGAWSFFINDNEVFYSVGYNNKCFVYDISTGQSRKLDIPEGYFCGGKVYPKCGKATVCIQYPNGEKVWSFGLLDTVSLKYEEVLRIDMKGILATPDDKTRALKRGAQPRK